MNEDEASKRPSVVLAEKEALEKLEAKRAEVEGLISALEGRATDLVKKCEHLQRNDQILGIQDFRSFQDLASESMTFLILIERKLKTVPKGEESELGENFYDLVVAIWSVVMKGALAFLSVISSEPHMPLGAREVFLRELRVLNDAQTMLDGESYKDRLTDEMKREMKTAEHILNEVLEKAPTLLAH